MSRALVLGAGIAGLASSAALAPLFDEVLLLERDELPSVPRRRRGVPQGDQLHNLLGRAQLHLEELLPGFLDQLRRAGCGEASVANETYVYELGSVMPARDLGIRMMSAPRPTIEHEARSILLSKYQNVEVREATAATGLIANEQGISGVWTAGAKGGPIEADLVVDAMGAGTPADRWLAAIGHVPPATNTAEPDQWYVSVVVIRRRQRNEPRFWLVFPTPPTTRGALLSPISSDRWYLSVNGRASDPIPTTYAEVLGHVGALEDHALAIALQSAEPQGQPHRYRRTSIRWRRYDRHPAPLPGFVPVGDALAALNPLFGQGISVAAWESAILRDTLVAHPRADLLAATVAYHKEAAKACAAVWQLGELVEGAILGEDRGDASEVRRRCGQFMAMIHADPQLHRDYVSVWHLLAPASVLRATTLAISVDRPERP